MSDNDIGRPDKHDPGAYITHDDKRPHGGYVEQRLSKLEYYQEQIRMEQDSVRNTLVNTYSCQACAGVMGAQHTHMRLPICNKCLDNLGKLTRAEAATNFTE